MNIYFYGIQSLHLLAAPEATSLKNRNGKFEDGKIKFSMLRALAQLIFLLSNEKEIRTQHL